jgi:hypothetical protein
MAFCSTSKHGEGEPVILEQDSAKITVTIDQARHPIDALAKSSADHLLH